MNAGRSSGLKLFALIMVHNLTLTLARTTSVDAFSSDEIRATEKFSGDVMGCINIPGLSIGVVRGDATFATGLGVANMATGHSVDRKTMFNLGSTSKALVPFILADILNDKENHDGRITWNSTLREILRHDRDIEVPGPWAEVTLKDMLVYKSGSSAADIATMVGLPEEVTREEIIRRLRFLPDNTEFLHSNHHSNIMYTVAGHLAERMTGLTWSELVKRRVLEKHHMNMSSFTPEGMTHEDSAFPYRFHSSKDPFVEQNVSLFNFHPFLPVASLMASADDMTKWLRHLLHNLQATGNDSGINMLVADAFHHWVSVPSDHREGTLSHESEAALGYGMGWYASTYRGQKRFKFSGSVYAYSSQIWLFPESLSAIFVSINGPGNERALRALEGIMFYISDITLKKPTWVDTNLTCCCQIADYDYDDHKDEIALEELKMVKYLGPVEKYIGNYGHGLVGDLKIEPNGAGILILKLGRNLVGELTPGVTESKLKFTVSSPLLNTEEWYSEKTIEFLYLAPQTGGERNTGLYDKVRIYIKDNLFYEFNRGTTFEGLLTAAEEDDRRQQEETKDLIPNNHRGKSNNNETFTNEVDYVYDDNDAVKEVGNHEINYTVSNLHHGNENMNSNFHENDAKSSSKLGPGGEGEDTSEKTNNHHNFSSEDQSDEPSLSETDKHPVGDTNHQQKEKHPHNKSADSASCRLQMLYTLTYLMLFLTLNV